MKSLANVEVKALSEELCEKLQLLADVKTFAIMQIECEDYNVKTLLKLRIIFHHESDYDEIFKTHTTTSELFLAYCEYMQEKIAKQSYDVKLQYEIADPDEESVFEADED